MHTSLDQALGRQPRPNRVGQSILNIGGDASAAYSLRSLTGGEPKAVRIRRDGDNDERDFTTAEIVNEAAAWTNGLQETALPADLGVTSFTTSALAYGLSSSGVSLAGGASLDDFDGTFTPNSDGTVWSNGSALGVNYAFGADSWVLNFNDGTNSGSISISSTAKYPFEVTNWGSAGVSSGVSGLASAWDQSFTDTYLDFAAAYGETTTYPTAAAAYSLRKVRSTYSGPAVRIRRTSDDIDADVAFDTNDTVSNDSIVTEVLSGNQSTLQAFISGTNAAVAIWYDQSGSSKNATQTTDANQPLIAESGSLHTDDGKPALKFNGTSHRLELSSKATIANTSIFSSFRSNTNTQDSVLLHLAVDASNAVSIGLGDLATRTELGSRLRVGGSNVVEVGDNTFTSTSQSLLGYIASSTAAKLFVDSTEETATVQSRTSGVNNRIGARGDDAKFFNGDISEVILFDSDQTNNRFKIESNINNHYTIYTAAKNGFVNKWYDQSSNSRNAVAAADANEPKIVENGNYLGELSFDGTNHTLRIATVSTLGINGSNNKSAFAVARTTAGTDGFVIAGLVGGSNFESLRYRSNASGGEARVEVSGFGVNDGDLSDGNNHVYSSIFDGTQTKDFDVSLDGSITEGSGTDAINTDGTATFFISKTGGNAAAGFTREFILYASDQTANRTAIETNIANEYGINLS